MPSSENDSLIGGGLLRLLADTSVLLYKTKHICWRASGQLGDGLRSVIRQDHAALGGTADDIAHHITDLGVEIPSDFSELSAMSSVKAGTNGLGVAEAIAAIYADHRTILADIETLRVTLPLEGDDKTVELLDQLSEHHHVCWEKLKDLLPRAEDTVH